MWLAHVVVDLEVMALTVESAYDHDTTSVSVEQRENGFS